MARTEYLGYPNYSGGYAAATLVDLGRLSSWKGDARAWARAIANKFAFNNFEVKMKLLCVSSSLALFMATSLLVLADDQPTDTDKAEGKARAQRFRSGDQPNGEGKPGQRRPGQFAGGFSPEQMAERMIEEFDADGDEKLDATELLKMMTTMRERRGAGMQRRPGGQGRPSPRDRSASPGGEEPKRPPVTE